MTTPAASHPEAISANPLYQQLRRRRNRLAGLLTLVMLVSYFGFIGLVAFNKELLASHLDTPHLNGFKAKAPELLCEPMSVKLFAEMPGF